MYSQVLEDAGYVPGALFGPSDGPTITGSWVGGPSRGI